MFEFPELEQSVKKYACLRIALSIFSWRCLRHSQQLVEQVILGQAFLMSGRKISIWMGNLIKDQITYPTLCNMLSRLKAEIDSPGRIEQISQAPIPADIEALIVDGIWGRFRRQGKRVLLTALGVDSSGSIHVLDWLVAKSESALSWIRLFERLRERGLGNIRLIVGDGSQGLPSAGQQIFPGSQFQICLWHLCQDLMRQMKGFNWMKRQCLYHDFWETFLREILRTMP